MTDNTSPSIYPEDYLGNEWSDDWITYRDSRRHDPHSEELDESSSLSAST
jgi:hypothetical protein